MGEGRRFKSMTIVILYIHDSSTGGQKRMKNKLLQTSLITLSLGLILLSQLPAAFGTDWTLSIADDVSGGGSVTLTYADIVAMPKTTVYADLICITQLIASGVWGGVNLGYLIGQATGINLAAQSLIFRAQDGYSVSISLGYAMQQNVIVAYERDGAPLPETLRLVLPGQNGNLWIAWITSITLSPEASVSTPTMVIPEPPGTSTSSPGTSTPTPNTPTQPSQSPTPLTPVQEPAQPNVTDAQQVQEARPSTERTDVAQLPSSHLTVPSEYGYPIVFAAIVMVAAGASYIVHDCKKQRPSPSLP
jgi:hypothetical protein